MVDYHKTLLNTLTTALGTSVPVYYEVFVNAKTLPCVSYYEMNNYNTKKGDTIKYSTGYYSVKVWADKVEDLQTISGQIDTALNADYDRTASSEQWFDGLGCKILTYKANFKEE